LLHYFCMIHFYWKKQQLKMSN